MIFFSFERESERRFLLLCRIYIYTQISVLKVVKETKIHRINYPKKCQIVCVVCLFFSFLSNFSFSMVSLLVARSIQCRFVAIVAPASGGPAGISAAYVYQCPVQIETRTMHDKLKRIIWKQNGNFIPELFPSLVRCHRAP